MNCRLSVIIPNRNGAHTIGLCLEALFNSNHDAFEVLVVDDCSTDNSVEIIQHFPCSLIRLDNHTGAAGARNIGARHSAGEILFFTDADCLVREETLLIAEKAAKQWGKTAVIGGSYTCEPFDHDFFSRFQSVFIHFSELKNSAAPDYIAAHAMVIFEDTFRRSGGFPDDFLPIIEDVEFSHRLRRQGYSLKMEPQLQVQHIFHFRTLADSMKNGFKKSKYWTIYSLGNRDLPADSGTASLALKINTLVFALISIAVVASLSLAHTAPLQAALVLFLFNSFFHRHFFALLYRTGGLCFAIPAALYYMLVYPLAVGTGGLTGLATFVLNSRFRPGRQP